jgi:hypothetical protein
MSEWSHPWGTGRLGLQPGEARLPAARSAAWAPRSTACAPSLCLLLAGEPRFCGAFTGQTLL